MKLKVFEAEGNGWAEMGTIESMPWGLRLTGFEQEAFVRDIFEQMWDNPRLGRMVAPNEGDVFLNTLVDYCSSQYLRYEKIP